MDEEQRGEGQRPKEDVAAEKVANVPAHLFAHAWLHLGGIADGMPIARVGARRYSKRPPLRAVGDAGM